MFLPFSIYKSHTNHFYACGHQQGSKSHNMATHKPGPQSHMYFPRTALTAMCLYSFYLTFGRSGYNITSHIPDVHRLRSLVRAPETASSVSTAAKMLLCHCFPPALVKAVPAHLLQQQQPATATKVCIVLCDN